MDTNKKTSAALAVLIWLLTNLAFGVGTALVSAIKNDYGQLESWIIPNFAVALSCKT